MLKRSRKIEGMANDVCIAKERASHRLFVVSNRPTDTLVRIINASVLKCDTVGENSAIGGCIPAARSGGFLSRRANTRSRTRDTLQKATRAQSMGAHSTQMPAPARVKTGRKPDGWEDSRIERRITSACTCFPSNRDSPRTSLWGSRGASPGLVSPAAHCESCLCSWLLRRPPPARAAAHSVSLPRARISTMTFSQNAHSLSLARLLSTCARTSLTVLSSFVRLLSLARSLAEAFLLSLMFLYFQRLLALPSRRVCLCSVPSSRLPTCVNGPAGETRPGCHQLLRSPGVTSIVTGSGSMEEEIARRFSSSSPARRPHFSFSRPSLSCTLATFRTRRTDNFCRDIELFRHPKKKKLHERPVVNLGSRATLTGERAYRFRAVGGATPGEPSAAWGAFRRIGVLTFERPSAGPAVLARFSTRPLSLPLLSERAANKFLHDTRTGCLSVKVSIVLPSRVQCALLSSVLERLGEMSRVALRDADAGRSSRS